ncbi:MAG: DUF6159 family protein, partial [Methanothrix sp.]|nr:DUF6159 family protein [Methanothrix sp.]
ADKELVVFPLISALAALIILAAAYFTFPQFFAKAQGQDLGLDFYAELFLFYLVLNTVVIYFNSALVGAALIRIRGGNPTVGDGFKIANSHLKAILGYAAISATVGIILRWLSDRGSLGIPASSLVGLAWNLATFLAVPILVAEEIGPLDAIRKSSELLKKTWGEQIVGNLSIGAVFGVIFLVVFLLGAIITVAAFSAGWYVLALSLAGLFVLALICLGIISNALGGIFSAAVYNYAATGSAGELFGEDLIKDAFKEKPGKMKPGTI